MLVLTAPDVMHYINNLAQKRPNFWKDNANRFLNVDIKIAALVVSPFVVYLMSYTGYI